MNSEDEMLFEVFFPYAKKRVEAAKKFETRFAHYTSASTALSIIKNKKVWMRNALVMNDFGEIRHGRSCVVEALDDAAIGGRFRAAFDRLDAAIWSRFTDLYAELDFFHSTETYLMSVSEHGAAVQDEDKYGRLSMWRAYGGDTNVALVLNGKPFHGESGALGVSVSPVLYADQTTFLKHFTELVENVEKSLDKLAGVDAERVAQRLYSAILFAILSTKHPGFSEEKEWRVICSPKIYEPNGLHFDLEVVEGVPQKVFKIPLNDIPERGLQGIELPEFLEEIIIGPTADPYVIYEAFVHALEKEGVEKARDKVKISNIPLRR
ncbi:MAG: DUF2971 domain-containing protein [Pseudomonadota bacterium]